jgi:endonuclease/exonuclease/phosphatase family metal-dependent hydrolase
MIFLEVIFGALIVVALFGWMTTFHPAPIEPAQIQRRGIAKRIKKGQELKVMSWNIQYLAGKSFVFYYDILDGSGPDVRPTRQAIDATFEEVVRVIRDEDPDILQLQEVNVGAKNTGYDDQLTRIFDALSESYTHAASVWYWKSPFIPHPKIMGAVGMKLATFSKYEISEAVRYQLPVPHPNPITYLYTFRRAVMECTLPVDGAEPVVALNTHLDAFAQGDDTMTQQVAYLARRLQRLSEKGACWFLGGDLNLLPTTSAYDSLSETFRAYYSPQNELSLLSNRYAVIPTLNECDGPQRERWFTFFSNNPAATGLDRTLDYLFYSSQFSVSSHHVRQADTRKISDHYPVIATFVLPGSR